SCRRRSACMASNRASSKPWMVMSWRYIWRLPSNRERPRDAPGKDSGEALHCTRMPRAAQAGARVRSCLPGGWDRWQRRRRPAIPSPAGGGAGMALKDIERIEHTVDLAEFHGVHVWIWRLQYVFMALFMTAALL